MLRDSSEPALLRTQFYTAISAAISAKKHCLRSSLSCHVNIHRGWAPFAPHVRSNSHKHRTLSAFETYSLVWLNSSTSSFDKLLLPNNLLLAQFTRKHSSHSSLSNVMTEPRPTIIYERHTPESYALAYCRIFFKDFFRKSSFKLISPPTSPVFLDYDYTDIIVKRRFDNPEIIPTSRIVAIKKRRVPKMWITKTTHKESSNNDENDFVHFSCL